MIYFEYPSKKAAFYFAAEEYIMQDIKPAEPVVMLWRTGDTVMVGANQIADMEIDKYYALSQGIDIVRRSSGGGTIFTDPGTLLYTIILQYDDNMDPKEAAKEYFSTPVICALAKLGIVASPEGRNDILIEGKKISGIAQYVKHGYLCTHGSLLFDADLDKLSRVLTVDREKITTKALRSVSSRVGNIADHTETKDINLLINEILAQQTTERRVFCDSDINTIQNIMREKYESEEWTYGHCLPFTFRNSHRFPCGEVEVYLTIRNGLIEDCRIHGDFLSLRPVSEMESAIKGAQYSGESLVVAISSIKLTNYIGAVSIRDFLYLLLGEEIPCNENGENN